MQFLEVEPRLGIGTAQALESQSVKVHGSVGAQGFEAGHTGEILEGGVGDHREAELLQVGAAFAKNSVRI